MFIKRYLFSLVFVMSFSVVTAQTQADSVKEKITELENRIRLLEDQLNQKELEDLLREAETKAEQKKEEKKSKTFKSGQRSLQAINPEISVTGDLYGQYVHKEEDETGAYFRIMGIHIQSNLDPFSLAKAAIGLTPEGVELGEAYMTWSNFLPNLSLTAGKFRQNFGVINRWHAHSLDQFDFPLALTTILGKEGLNQIGVSLNWLMPSFLSDANSLTIEITDGLNDRLFSGKTFTFPVILTHLKNYWDLSPNTYFELGITGMFGKNKTPNTINGLLEEVEKNTLLAGLDVTLFWQPVNKALYKSFVWRTELYYTEKELTEPNKIKALGGYSYLQYQLNEKWYAGFRFDFTQPFELENSDKSITQIVPYVVWWQSHWVRLRLQYNFLKTNYGLENKSLLRLQLTWAMGPHKHDRY